jgi:divalent metal cation (Fe/Co/Zn/Cd) transporter
MASVLQIAPPDAIRRIQRVQRITIAWMSVEALVSLFAAWRARSPVLLAFGGDSAIELFSAVVVLWRFRASAAVREDAERRAAQIAGGLLFALAACVVATSVMALLGYSEPKPTLLGIAILIAAAAFMPLLAKEKRRLSGATGSAALRADAAQSALCAYLSLIALAGLAINAIWHVKWADPIAALAVLPLIVWEGREAMRGKACGCC